MIIVINIILSTQNFRHRIVLGQDLGPPLLIALPKFSVGVAVDGPLEFKLACTP